MAKAYSGYTCLGLLRVLRTMTRHAQAELGLSRWLASAGQGSAAAHAFLAAATLAAEDEALDLRRRAADQLLMSGHIDDGTAVLRSVLRSVGLRFPTRERPALIGLIWHTALLRLRGLRYRERPEADVPRELLQQIDVCWTIARGLAGASPIHSLAFTVRGARLALRAGEPARIANFMTLYATVMSGMGSGRVQRERSVAQEAAARSGDDYAQIFAQFGRTVSFYFTGEFEDCLVRCDDIETTLRERFQGVAWEIVTLQSIASFARMLLGDWRTTAKRASVHIREAEQRGDLYGATMLSMALGWVKHVAADDPEAAMAELDRYLGR